MKDKDIIKIVLTGGPCAGKSTVFDTLNDYLTEKGYYVITVSETATELIRSKILPNPSDKEHTLMFQDILLHQQYTKELISEVYAKKMAKNQKEVILYDRSILDNRAYLDSKEDFDYILNKNNLDELEVLNSYDLVLNLISVATCKPECYKLDGVRYETLEDAQSLDKRTSTAWIHHPNFKAIKPTDTIEEKINLVITEVDNYLSGIKNNNKENILLDYNSDLSIYNDNNSKTINIFNIYLSKDLVLTKKEYYNSVIYTKSNYSDINSEIIISENEFIDLIYKFDVIYTERKKEINFIDNGNVYKIIECDDKIYLEKEKDIYLNLPNNLIVSKDQAFVKRKKYDNI